MIDHLIIEHEKLVKKRLGKFSISKAAKDYAMVPLKGKILFSILLVSVLVSVVFFYAWWFTPTPNNYGLYMLYSLVFVASAFYSIYRNAMDEMEKNVYKDAQDYKGSILAELRDILIKYDVFSRKKIKVLVDQCDAKIADTEKFLKPLSLFLQIFFIPLLIASFQVFFIDQKTAVLYALLIATLGLMFYGILYLLSPIKNLFESENVKRIENLKKELQDLQLFYFD